MVSESVDLTLDSMTQPVRLKAEYERLRSAVVEAAQADLRAEESKYGDNRDIDNLIATRRAYRAAVIALNTWETEHLVEQKDGK